SPGSTAHLSSLSPPTVGRSSSPSTAAFSETTMRSVFEGPTGRRSCVWEKAGPAISHRTAGGLWRSWPPRPTGSCSTPRARERRADYQLSPWAGGGPRLFPPLAPAAVLARWPAAGHGFLVNRGSDVPARLERVALAPGRRELFHRLAHRISPALSGSKMRLL